MTEDIIMEILLERPMNGGDSACNSCTISLSSLRCCKWKANPYSEFKRVDFKLRSETRCSYVTHKQSSAHCEDSIAISLSPTILILDSETALVTDIYHHFTHHQNCMEAS